jgi:hypothetical protein
MTALTALWLPILVSAVFVFIASSIIHMTPLWHKNDYAAVPDQDRVMESLRPFNIPPGDYMMPRAASMAEMKTDAFKQKIAKGPMAIMTVLPNREIPMGKSLTLWFLFIVAVSYFSAYIASRALAPGANYLEVFRFAGATAFIAYVAALWPMSIWYQRAWSLTVKGTIDGLIYALLTAGTFGWLWPSAS